ncbi:MAG: aminopeptidase P family protein [Eubacteriales bacterium]|nr:aminopeptidase P family protein [Clostridiales bacterium]MDD6721261.1 aminopeptidase P family protein [Clostridiales bacterium]MDY5693221.1 aminopeptidase P family protein [Eubacteriales bacterium]
MIAERLSRLRALMQQKGVGAYYVPTADFHLSEYVNPYFKSRQYLTGFTGSAGTLVVTMDEAALWVDGRYFIQAEEQLSGTPVKLMKMGEEGVPSVLEYLSKLPEGTVIGLDGRTVSAAMALRMEKTLSTRNITLEPDMDLVGDIWPDRPPLPNAPVYVLGVDSVGVSAADKIADIRRVLVEKDADAHVLCTLDDIAWLFNLRGGDVECNPVFLSYAIIERDAAYIFADKSKFHACVQEYLRQLNVTLLPYNDIYEFASKYDEGDAILLSTASVNYTLYDKLYDKAIIIDEENPEQLKKAIKNPVEIENMRKAHIKDGLAVTRFMRWVKENVGKEPISELSAAAKMDSLRLETEGNLGRSFSTISAYGPHAALPHYAPTEESNLAVEPRGFLLMDSGGQYYEGTTDITRTIAVGPLTDTEKKHFALVLRSMLRLANARFLYGCRGLNLDILARGPLWDEGLDFKHGTGHGIGYLLNVHEAPNGFRWKIVPERVDSCVFEEGMITSDEPGIYIEGSHGIRTENLIVCRKGEKNEYGQFMYFETLTMAPIDLDAIDPSYLNDAEKQQLNDYHRLVYEKLSPYMDDGEREWLRKYTRAI